MDGKTDKKRLPSTNNNCYYILLLNFKSVHSNVTVPSFQCDDITFYTVSLLHPTPEYDHCREIYLLSYFVYCYSVQHLMLPMQQHRPQ